MSIMQRTEGEIWLTRLQTLGHTGWADSCIYAYDQLERLEIIASAIRGMRIQNCRALDFGCGTGDFSRLLIDLGCDCVFGYDPYVQPAIPLGAFYPIQDIISIEQKSLDLVLAVTVLDHILDDRKLDAVLATIHGLLKPGGRVALLEYAVEYDRIDEFSKSDYQAFRSVSDWQKSLGRFFDIESFTSAWHPIHAPSPGYNWYISGVVVPLAKRSGLFRRSNFGRRLIARRARKALLRFPPSLATPITSPLKLIFCRKALGG